MTHPFHALVSIAVAAWLSCPSAGARGTPVEAATGQAAEEARASQEVADEQQTRAQVEHLAGLEAERRAWSELEAKHHQALLGLQAARADAWSEVLRTNWSVYQTLRQQAADSRRLTAHCTICNGRGSMAFCVVCGNNGKCVRCNGTGKVFGEPCPTCRGSGKCFLCFGTGKMPCPFCDDGDVYFIDASPPTMLPVPAASTVEPSPHTSPQPNLAMEARNLPLGGITTASAQQSGPSAQPSRDVAWPDTSGSTLGFTVALVLSGILVVRRVAPRVAEHLNARFNPWAPSTATTANRAAKLLAEEEAVTRFLTEFRVGPNVARLRTPSGDPDASKPALKPPEALEPQVAPLERFLASGPKQVQELRKLLQEIGRAPEGTDRQENLRGLEHELHQFKDMAGLPEVQPAWQMACALEWLIKQLIEKPSRVTASTLRTVGSGLDLLLGLCRPGLRANLCADPPIRLLAVDDDAISRRAISFALKKGVSQPDLAEDGQAALALATKQPYDVIFLDVQMPGMDGFEVCSKIHQTLPNQHTPVVFVTAHSDFDARAKSALCGGNDLIGKPFLIFEITVKALTFALRARVNACESSTQDSTTGTLAEAATPPPVTGAATAGVAPNAERESAAPLEQSQPSSPTVIGKGVPAQSIGSRCGPESSSQPAVPAVQAVPQQISASGPHDSVGTFFAHAPARLKTLREMLQEASETVEGDVRQAKLVELYCRVSSLAPLSGCAELRPAGQVLAALESMLKKLIEHRHNATPSMFQTMAAALDLLADLCVPGLRPDLGSNPPLHLLVVDDDPLARRAVAGGLQIAFKRPELAGDGEAAVVLAKESRFDLIFMDVQMPGMDGLTACARIRETAANRLTPVVFITSHDDAETRQASVRCGGSDFIAKPFLCSELTLKALTFALRGRLQKLGSAHGDALSQCGEAGNALTGVTPESNTSRM